MTSSEPLPSFDRPPLIESALAVQFDPLSVLGSQEIVKFATELGDGWGSPSITPPVGQQLDRYPGEDHGSWTARLVQFRANAGQIEPYRVRVRSLDSSRMIQLENGWLVYNWLKADQREDYPRYGATKEGFLQTVRQLREYCSKNLNVELAESLWEVAYINHIPEGQLWKEVGDWPELLPGLLGIATINSDPTLDSCNAGWRIPIDDKRASLNVKLDLAVRNNDGTRVITLSFRARGSLESSEELVSNLDCGHEAIVRKFAEVTSKNAHEVWGRTS